MTEPTDITKAIRVVLGTATLLSDMNADTMIGIRAAKAMGYVGLNKNGLWELTAAGEGFMGYELPASSDNPHWGTW